MVKKNNEVRVRKPKTPKQKLTEENDKIWSLIVRERDNYTCRMCGNNERVEAAHIFGRMWKATRWWTSNGISLCYYCHRFKMHGGNLDEEKKIEFFKKCVGEEVYERLREKHLEPVKFDLAFVQGWNLLLRNEFLAMFGKTYEDFLKERRKK